MAKNGNFTRGTATAMIDTLITMGIMLNHEQYLRLQALKYQLQ